MRLKKATVSTIDYPTREQITPILLSIALSFSACSSSSIESERDNIERNQTEIEEPESIAGGKGIVKNKVEVPYVLEGYVEPPNISIAPEENSTVTVGEQNQSTVIKPVALKGKVKY